MNATAFLKNAIVLPLITMLGLSGCGGGSGVRPSSDEQDLMPGSELMPGSD